MKNFHSLCDCLEKQKRPFLHASPPHALTDRLTWVAVNQSAAVVSCRGRLEHATATTLHLAPVHDSEAKKF